MTEPLPGVRLRPMADHDAAVLERWMRIPDVYSFLDFEEPPTRHHLRFAVLAKRVEVLIIDLAVADAAPVPAGVEAVPVVNGHVAVGFFLLYFKGFKRTGTREFDIAVPAPEARRKGVAKAAIIAFEEWCFTQQGYKGIWAKIFADNVPCLSFVRNGCWPLSEVKPGATRYRGQPRDMRETYMTPALLPEARKKRGW